MGSVHSEVCPRSMNMPCREGIYRGAERRNTMKRKMIIGWIMAAIGLLGAVVTVVLRVWLMPAQRDNDTGLFSTNNVVIILTLVLVVALAVLALLMRSVPRDKLEGKSSLFLALVVLVAGVTFVFTGALDIWSAVRADTLPMESSRLTVILQWLQRIFCLLSGVALARFGLQLTSDDTEQQPITQWSLLAPVIWMWLLLVNYEMNSASMVRLTSGYFTLMTYIAELLFLFYFARYMAGVGKVGVGMMLLFSSGAALFALSTPAVQIITHLMGDSAAFEAAGTADDLGLHLMVGLLAVTMSVTLCQRLSAVSAAESKAAEETMEDLGLIGFEDKPEPEEDAEPESGELVE